MLGRSRGFFCVGLAALTSLWDLGIYIMASFDIESYDNPDDGNRVSLWNVSLFQPLDIVVSPRTFYCKVLLFSHIIGSNPGVHLSFCQTGSERFFHRDKRGHSGKLTTHIHTGQSLGMRGARCLLPHKRLWFFLRIKHRDNFSLFCLEIKVTIKFLCTPWIRIGKWSIASFSNCC
jgi:hypothetical protein